ncbi:hypothetical protein SH1V18_30780 [Vallitalea longa]|uniref:Copper amine oxidase-like N-terminal domain-containing protein n=1 Tax=Vallitalea longa TaxID=2936439 RepID=A0A9W5YG64_9FIRM|nr:stalk domain-containing protein [Vallitalea longa]GKX30598.1 hypothetical protein SH1V18_30780 [Vallitalea longa]
MRKSIKVLLSLVLIMTLSATVSASSLIREIAGKEDKGIIVKYNNQFQDLKDDNGNFVYPVVINDSPYLPVRAISEILNANITWDGKTKTIFITENSNKKDLDKCNLSKTKKGMLTFNGETINCYLEAKFEDNKCSCTATTDKDVDICVIVKATRDESGDTMLSNESDYADTRSGSNTLTFEDYDNAKAWAKFTKGDKSIELSIDKYPLLSTTLSANELIRDITGKENKEITVNYNNKVQDLKDANGNPVYPVVINDSTYFPVKAISEMSGADITWDTESKTIFITENGIKKDLDKCKKGSMIVNGEIINCYLEAEFDENQCSCTATTDEDVDKIWIILKAKDGSGTQTLETEKANIRDISRTMMLEGFKNGKAWAKFFKGDKSIELIIEKKSL